MGLACCLNLVVYYPLALKILNDLAFNVPSLIIFNIKILFQTHPFDFLLSRFKN